MTAYFRVVKYAKKYERRKRKCLIRFIREGWLEKEDLSPFDSWLVTTRAGTRVALFPITYSS